MENLKHVTTVTEWYRHGHFDNEDEARGAFKLAHQQALDGMGASHNEWMGLTEEERAEWHRHDTLPPKERKSADEN